MKTLNHGRTIPVSLREGGGDKEKKKTKTIRKKTRRQGFAAEGNLNAIR